MWNNLIDYGMNIKYLFLVFILWFVVAACDNEDTLYPTEPENGVTFNFPEGSDTWDQDLEEIAARFGTKCIYKNLEEADYFRTWTASASGATNFIVSKLPDACLIKLYTQFFKDHIFRFLSPECTKGVLPNYIFFAYDFCSVSKRALSPGDTLVYHSYNSTKMKFDGMGFWSFCYETEEHLTIMGQPWKGSIAAGDVKFVQEERDILLRNIFRRMVDAGTIVPPVEFEAGGELDYVTPITYGDVQNENYYMKRGFPKRLTNLKSYGNFGDLWSIANTGRIETFVDYLNLALRLPKIQVYADYADYPLIIKFYDLTVKYMREKYDMDIAAIAEMAEPLTE